MLVHPQHSNSILFMDTECIIRQLGDAYPHIERATLLELLVACDGSKTATEHMIDESLPATSTLKKRKADKPRYQSSLSSLLPKRLKTPSPAAATPVSGGRNVGKVIRLYHPDDVRAHLHPYVSLHRSFLPHQLSNDLLQDLVDNTHKFSPHEFYLFGQPCKADHATGVFMRDKVSEISPDYVYNGVKVDPDLYPPLVKEASTFSENFMNETIIVSRHLQGESLPFEQIAPDSNGVPYWQADKCIVNHYEANTNHLDWHSDRLSHMGPHCYIVSISLGATREFRVRRTYNNEAMEGDARKPPTTIYSIVLPHNSMLIMHPGCQEEFKHCVQPMKGPLEVNPISGTARFNLTFRHFPQVFHHHVPKCACNLQMTLRRAFKDVATRGRYFWTCEKKYLNKDCGTFYWADFKNFKGNLIYNPEESGSTISEWVAFDDFAKKRYLQHEAERQAKGNVKAYAGGSENEVQLPRELF